MIRTTIGGGPDILSFDAGTLAGAGAFECAECGYSIALQALDEVPACPSCAGRRFRRASMFVDHSDSEPEAPTPEEPDWLEETRDSLVEGDHVAWEDEAGVHVVALGAEWTRIGRSLAAHVRFDDPTVSRRHALIHRRGDIARVLDDRSLNGVFLNGERVDWHELGDRDEIAVGRFRLYFMSNACDRAAAADLGAPA